MKSPLVCKSMRSDCCIAMAVSMSESNVGGVSGELDIWLHNQMQSKCKWTCKVDCHLCSDFLDLAPSSCLFAAYLPIIIMFLHVHLLVLLCLWDIFSCN
jgi:hypothetical protein